MVYPLHTGPFPSKDRHITISNWTNDWFPLWMLLKYERIVIEGYDPLSQKYFSPLFGIPLFLTATTPPPNSTSIQNHTFGTSAHEKQALNRGLWWTCLLNENLQAVFRGRVHLLVCENHWPLPLYDQSIFWRSPFVSKCIIPLLRIFGISYSPFRKRGRVRIMI